MSAIFLESFRRPVLFGLLLGMVALLAPPYVFAEPGWIYTIEQPGSPPMQVTPIAGETDVTSFYDYRDSRSNTGLEQVNVSQLFLYKEPNGRLGLVIIHDRPGGGGGHADFTISGLPTHTSFPVVDDPSELKSVSENTAIFKWQWINDFNDGAALRLGTNGPFEIEIDPVAFKGIISWKYVQGSVTEPSDFGLDAHRPLILRATSSAPAIPNPPVFHWDTPLPKEDARVCMPPFMAVPESTVHHWWVRAAGGEMTIEPIAVGVNPDEKGKVNFAVFGSTGNTPIATRTIDYSGLGGGTTPEENERSADVPVRIDGTTAGDLYRVEVTLSPPTPLPDGSPVPTAHHYRIKTTGASTIGTNSPMQTNAEPTPTAWAVNVLDREELNVLVSPGLLGPATGDVEIRDPSGMLVPTGGAISSPISIISGPQGTWTVTMPNSTGHYVIDKTSGADRGIYLNWKSFGTGNVKVTTTQAGAAYSGPFRVQIKDPLSGQIRTEPPEGPFSGGSATIGLPVGNFKVRVVSAGRQTDWVDASVTCDDTATLSFNLPVLDAHIDLKPGSWPNSINLNGNGVQPVALFGSQWLDVSRVNVSSVRFGVDGVEASAVHNGHIEDVNADGIPDMVFHFREFQLGIDVNTPGETTMPLYLKGALNNGVLFKGSDIARITPNNQTSRGKGGKGPK